MSRRARAGWIAVTAGAVTIAVVVVLVLRRGDDPSGAPLSRAAEPAAPAIEAERAPAVVEPEREVAAASQRLDGERPATVVIRVVDARTGEPLPSAEVWVATREELWNRERDVDPEELLDLELRLHGHGRRLELDGTGELRIPAERQPALACARAGELFGMLGFTTKPEAPVETHVLELRPDVDLEVRVVDPDGRPAGGVPVRVAGRRAGSYGPTTTHSTRADGATVFKHAACNYADFLDDGELVVGLDLPLRKQPEVVLPGSELAESPVQLLLPPTGRLVVEVTDTAGDPWSERGSVSLEVLGVPVPEAGSRWHRARIDGGVARFEHVGPGLELRAMLSIVDRSSAIQDGPGPARPGDEVRWTLRAGPRMPVLVGIAVDGAGEPLREARLSCSLASDEGVEESGPICVTDGEGRFRFVLRSATPELTPRAATLQLQTADWLVAGRSRPIPLRGVLPQGELDLGRIQVSELPPLVAGTVVDEEGEPVSKVAVRLLVPSANGEDWADSYGRQARTDAAGRFEFIQVDDPRVGAVVASPNGRLQSRPTPFFRGQRDLVVVLRPRPALRGSVRIEPELRDALRVATLREVWVSRSARVDEDGSFTITPLEPGTHVVSFRLRSGEELLRVPDVLVTEGESPEDPRLQDVDLTGLVRAFELHVVDANGAPVERVSVRHRRAGGAQADWMPRELTAPEIRLPLYSQYDALDLCIDAPGHRTVERFNVSGDLEVALPPSIPVRLLYPAGLDLPEELELVVSLRSERPRTSRATSAVLRTARVPLDPRQGALLELPAPGEWEVVPRLEWVDADGRQRTRKLQTIGDPQILHVADTTAEQSFVVTVDAKRLASALRKVPR